MADIFIALAARKNDIVGLAIRTAVGLEEEKRSCAVSAAAADEDDDEHDDDGGGYQEWREGVDNISA